MIDLPIKLKIFELTIVRPETQLAFLINPWRGQTSCFFVLFFFFQRMYMRLNITCRTWNIHINGFPRLLSSSHRELVSIVCPIFNSFDSIIAERFLFIAEMKNSSTQTPVAWGLFNLKRIETQMIASWKKKKIIKIEKRKSTPIARLYCMYMSEEVSSLLGLCVPLSFASEYYLKIVCIQMYVCMYASAYLTLMKKDKQALMDFICSPIWFDELSRDVYFFVAQLRIGYYI